MATASAHAEYVASLGVDLANLEKGLAEARRKLGDFGKGVPATGVDAYLAQASAKFKKWGQDLERVGTSLSLGITAPLTLLGKKILDVGIDYEKSMNTFAAVTRATSEEMARAAEVATRLGNDAMLPAVSAATAAQAMSELGKSGLSASQSMDAARGVLLLSTAAQMDAAKAAEIAGNALNTFGLAAGEAGRVADLLAAASNASSAEVSDIAMSMQQAGASAAALKVPIEDLVTGIGLMANAGMKGSDSGTSMKVMLDALTPNTKAAAAAMKSLGIDAFDASGKFVGFEAIIKQAAPALARMTDEQKANAIQTAFGSDAQRAANIILGQGEAAWRKMSDAVGVSGAAAELAAAKTKGLGGAWESLKSQLETAALNVFKALAPTMETVVRRISDMASGLSSLGPEVIKFGVAVAGVAGTAGPLALLVGKLAQLGPTGTVVAGVIAGAALMAGAYTSNFGAMQRTLDDFFARFNTGMKQGESSAGSFATFLSKVGIGMVALVDQLLVSVQKIAVNISQAMKLIIAGAQGNWNAMGIIWGEGRRELERIDREFNERHQQRENEAMALMRGGVTEHWKLLRDRGAVGASDYSKAIIEGYKQADPFGHINKISIGEIEGLIPKLRATGLQAGLGIGSALKEGAYKATHQSPFFLIHWLEDAVKYASTEFPEKLKGAGKKAAEQFKEAFQSILGNVNDWLGRAGGSGTISDDVFAIILRNMPKVAEELKRQGDSFVTTNKAIELYSALMATSAGKTDLFALRVTYAINSLIGFDKSLRETHTRIYSLNDAYGDMLVKMEHVTIITPKMSEAIEKSVGSLVELTINAKKSGDAAQKLADEDFKRLLDVNNELSRQLPNSWNIILDAIVNASGRAGSAVLQLSNKVKGWAVDIIGVVDTLPGKFGDVARRVLSTVDQWVTFTDKVLGVLSRLNSSIPSSVGGIIESIVGIFKGNGGGTSPADTVANAIGGMVSKASQSAAGAATSAGTAAGGAVTGGIASSITAGTPSALNALSGLFGAITQAVGVFAQTFHDDSKAVRFAGGFLVGGPVGGILSMIFGGPSAHEKEKRKLELDKMRADIAQTYEDIKSSMVDTMQKGIQLLESIADSNVIDLPRKSIKRFVNKLGLVLEMWLEESKRLKAEGLEHAKAVTDNLGDTFGFLFQGAELVERIRGLEVASDADVTALMESTDKILDGYFSVVEHIELGTAKRSGKISERLKPTVELVSSVPNMIEAVIKAAELDVTDEQIEKPVSTAKRIYDKFIGMVEELAGYVLQRTAKNSERFIQINEGQKAMFESLSLFRDYKPLEDALFDAPLNDFRKVTAFNDALIDESSGWLTQADTIRDNVLRWADKVGGTLDALRSTLGGSTSSSLSLGPQAALAGGGSVSVVPPPAAAPQTVDRRTVIQIGSFTLPDSAASDPRVGGFVDFLSELRLTSRQDA